MYPRFYKLLPGLSRGLFCSFLSFSLAYVLAAKERTVAHENSWAAQPTVQLWLTCSSFTEARPASEVSFSSLDEELGSTPPSSRKASCFFRDNDSDLLLEKVARFGVRCDVQLRASAENCESVLGTVILLAFGELRDWTFDVIRSSCRWDPRESPTKSKLMPLEEAPG